MKYKKCTECEVLKSYDDFGYESKGKDKKRAKCKVCRRKLHTKRRARKRKSNDIYYIASSLYFNMRKKHRAMGYKRDPQFTIKEIEDIILNGKCEVSKRSFNPENNTKYRVNPFMASPDRIDTSKGYTKKNVRWVMVWINKARQEYEIPFFKKLVKGVKW